MKVYKLFRMQNGQLHPLYVNANDVIPMGRWFKAEEGPMDMGKVKSRLGRLAYRPGWHSSDIPYETHIGKKENGVIAYLPNNYVWAECEIKDEINYQNEARCNGWNGNRVVASKAYIKHIPYNGYYRYKTNPNMYGCWFISGEIKVNRLLTDQEVIDICAEHGLVPLKREVSA